MADMYRSIASLRIIGDTLVPEEITRLLGHAPTNAAKKDERSRRKNGTERTARTGYWFLDAQDRIPGDPEGQIEGILNKLSVNPEVWRGITAYCRTDLFLGLFQRQLNEGFCLSPTTLMALGSRGIQLSLDIYGPGDAPDMRIRRE